MAMGMSYEDYWYGDVFMVVPYIEAYRLHKRQENERLWLQGLYFYDALSVALKRFGDGLAGKHSPDSVRYPVEPYQLYQEKKAAPTPEQLQEQEDREVRMARAYMMQMDAAFKRRA